MSTQQLTTIITEMKEYERMAEELQETIDGLKDQIKIYMGDQEEIVAGQYKVRYKTVVSSRLDSKALKTELPEIAARYSKESTCRRFTIA
jgi:Phage-related protein, predicted endonuclease